MKLNELVVNEFSFGALWIRANLSFSPLKYIVSAYISSQSILSTIEKKHLQIRIVLHLYYPREIRGLCTYLTENM